MNLARKRNYDPHFFANLTNLGYRNIYKHPILVQACSNLPIHHIMVEEVPEGDPQAYWGWKDFERKEYCMIWASKILLEICFPYGYRFEEERGKGKIVNLKIKDLGIYKGKE